MRRALVLEAAHAAVQPLGVLADDDEVDVVRALVLQRAVDAGVELHRAQVDVLVELEAQAQEQALLEDAGLHVRVADGAEVDGVEAAQLLEHRVRQDVAGLHVALAAEVVVLEVELEAELRLRRFEHLQPLADDLRPGAVAGQHRYPISLVLRHACIRLSIGDARTMVARVERWVRARPSDNTTSILYGALPVDELSPAPPTLGDTQLDVVRADGRGRRNGHLHRRKRRSGRDSMESTRFAVKRVLF